MNLDWSGVKTLPRDHQREGVQWFLTPEDPARGRIYPNCYLLADEVGSGKSKQVIDGMEFLFEARRTDAVLCVTPAPARGVWADRSAVLGEVVKHAWDRVPYAVREYSVLNDDLGLMRGIHGTVKDYSQPFLRWLVTNYEFVRREERLIPLLHWAAKRRFWLVCDEAWALKDQGTAQFEAVYQLRKLAQGVILLNGTPIADSPMDLNAQMKMLDERILGFPYVNKRQQRVISTADSRFRHYYAGLSVINNRKQAQEQMRKWEAIPMALRWPRLEELRAKVAPYILRRLTRDCFDLPEHLEPVLVEAKLKDDTWRLYKQMKDDMVAWLKTDEASVAKQAMVKGLRLAQITSGFLGGIQQMDLDDNFGTQLAADERLVNRPESMVKEISREKLDAMLEWLSRYAPQPDRILIWARFRLEIERAAAAFFRGHPEAHRNRRSHLLYGQQKKDDRQRAVEALNPALDPGELVVVVGSPQAGGAALNLAGASLAINLSHDFNLRVYLQARGRIDRPGQVNRIRYVDVVATGPKGQRTIDHHVLAALRDKEDIATWTAATWKKKLLEE